MDLVADQVTFAWHVGSETKSVRKKEKSIYYTLA